MTKGDDMGGFVLGFLMGLLAAIGILIFLAWWLCYRSNNIAIATFINGIAKAIVSINGAKSPEPSAPADNGEAMEEAWGTRKERKGKKGHERRDDPDETESP
jgi:hypothetical protein